MLFFTIRNQSKYSYDKVEGELGGRGELEEGEEEEEDMMSIMISLNS